MDCQKARQITMCSCQCLHSHRTAATLPLAAIRKKHKKRMRNIFLFLFVFIFCIKTSLSQKEKSEQIFEELLGNNNLKVLTDLILFYNNFLEENYSESDKDKRTLLFLKDIIDGRVENLYYDSIKTCKILESYFASTLNFKDEYLKYKEVKEVIKGSGMLLLVKQDGERNYLSLGNEYFKSHKAGKKVYLYLRDSLIDVIDVPEGEQLWLGADIGMLEFNQTIEERVSEMKERGYINHISSSKFIEAIDSIKESYSDNHAYDLIDYVNIIYNAGGIHYINLSYYLYSDYHLRNTELENYFLKRIIVYEIFVNFLAEKKRLLTMAIRPCQRGLPAANPLQANALCEFAGTSSIARRCLT